MVTSASFAQRGLTESNLPTAITGLGRYRACTIPQVLDAIPINSTTMVANDYKQSVSDQSNNQVGTIAPLPHGCQSVK
jgi:hypothetical protein